MIAELADIHFIYSLANGNGRVAVRLMECLMLLTKASILHSKAVNTRREVIIMKKNFSYELSTNDNLRAELVKFLQASGMRGNPQSLV
ncbi:hypothetical protein TNCV_4825611 [Trichonephila clavipes]|uniref:Uncharacterized protein n=1 Tax=Trichonephila clavipes TaxID=2585209 RepID=A0A8X6RHU4_TRICX|nr:hypothetical protein TNCV_4825611 [Trichonephila clavipes]